MKLREDLEAEILDKILEVRRQCPELIQVEVDVYKSYGLSRSFKRGSHLEAHNLGVGNSDIGQNNRWRKVDRSGSKQSRLIMINH